MTRPDSSQVVDEELNPMSLTPGLMLGAYRIERLLGYGGFGYLYRVSRDGQAYALKISRERPSDTEDEAVRRANEARLAREVAALKTIDHPNIVKIHAFDRWPTLEDGYAYFVMDLVEGVTVDRWRKRGSPSLRQVCEVVATLGDALDCIHSQQIFHRDLKPANVMVSSADGQPVLVDFGIARSMSAREVTEQGWSIGTIAYCAPEYAEWLQSPDVDRREPFKWGPGADLHALGHIFYELLTCRWPFPRPREGTGDTAMYEIIRTTVPTRPSVITDGAVPDEVDDVVMKLLEKRPEDRFPSGRELAAVLRAVAAAGGPEWDAPLPTPENVARSASSTNKPVPAGKSPARPGQPPAEATAASERLAPVSGVRASDARLLDRAAEHARAAGAARPEAAEFRPPTSAKRRFTGIGLAEAPGARQDRSSKDDDRRLLDTAMRNELGRVGGPRSRFTTGQKVFGAAILLVLAFFGAVMLSANSAAEQSGRRGSDLLRDAQRERREELARQQRDPPKPSEEVVKPITLSEAAAPEAAVRPPPTVPEPPRSIPENERPRAAEAGADVGAELPKDGRRHAEAGAGAAAPPRVEGGAGARRRAEGPPGLKAARAGEPSWIRRTVQLGEVKVAKKDRMGVPLGAHLRVKLLTNLDSRVPETPVEAIIATPYMLSDEVKIPPKTLLYGTASARGSRFSINFSRMRLPDHSEVEFRGLAIDIGDGKAGLRPARSVAPEQTSSPSLGARVARTTASSAVSAVDVGTGIGANLAKTAAGETVSGVGQDVGTGGGETAIMLDAPVLFDVFVESNF
jgi:eukaryotic-like serine/threonine-protein kinase